VGDTLEPPLPHLTPTLSTPGGGEGEEGPPQSKICEYRSHRGGGIHTAGPESPADRRACLALHDQRLLGGTTTQGSCRWFRCVQALDAAPADKSASRAR
jgi:hypothetical protein